MASASASAEVSGSHSSLAGMRARKRRWGPQHAGSSVRMYGGGGSNGRETRNMLCGLRAGALISPAAHAVVAHGVQAVFGAPPTTSKPAEHVHMNESAASCPAASV